ncbi:MAG: hypothetical protein Q9198_006281 [Flavoplaca austrocitrina]
MPYENTSGTENPGYGNAEFETDPGTTQAEASQLPEAHNHPLLRFQGTYVTIPPEQQIPNHSTVPLAQFNHQEQHHGLQPNLDTDGGMAGNSGHPATPINRTMPARMDPPPPDPYQLLAQQQQRFITNSCETPTAPDLSTTQTIPDREARKPGHASPEHFQNACFSDYGKDPYLTNIIFEEIGDLLSVGFGTGSRISGLIGKSMGTGGDSIGPNRGVLRLRFHVSRFGFGNCGKR